MRARFVEEYLIDLNATQAAIRAGYAPDYADRYGPSLLGKSSVKRAIEKAKRLRSIRTGAKADEVIREFLRLAYSDLSDYISWGPKGVKLVSSKKLTADQTAAVQELTIKAYGEIKIKLHPKIPALSKLAEHLNLIGQREALEVLIDRVALKHPELAAAFRAELGSLFDAQRAGEAANADPGEGDEAAGSG